MQGNLRRWNEGEEIKEEVSSLAFHWNLVVQINLRIIRIKPINDI